MFESEEEENNSTDISTITMPIKMNVQSQFNSNCNDLVNMVMNDNEIANDNVPILSCKKHEESCAPNIFLQAQSDSKSDDLVIFSRTIQHCSRAAQIKNKRMNLETINLISDSETENEWSVNQRIIYRMNYENLKQKREIDQMRERLRVKEGRIEQISVLKEYVIEREKERNQYKKERDEWKEKYEKLKETTDRFLH